MWNTKTNSDTLITNVHLYIASIFYDGFRRTLDTGALQVKSLCVIIPSSAYMMIPGAGGNNESRRTSAGADVVLDVTMYLSWADLKIELERGFP